MTLTIQAQKPIHAAHPLVHDGAVDADGHILEPPDLWERYIDPKFRDRALRIVMDENGLEELEIDGKRSQMARKGFPSTLGAMGDPDLRSMQFDPERTYLRESPYGAMDPNERLDVLDAENIDIAILYTTVGLLWEAELEDPELSQAYTRAYNRWICEFCADAPRLVPTAHLSLADPEAAATELERAVGEGAKGAYVAPFTHTVARSAIPTTTRCSRLPRTSASRSRSIRRSSRSGPRARAWGRGRTSSSSDCSRRCRRPMACATSSRPCSTTACSTSSRDSRCSCSNRAADGSGTGSTASMPSTATRSSATRAARSQAERLLPRARLDQLRPRRAHDPGSGRAVRRRAVHVGVGLPARRSHAGVRRRPRRARARRSPRVDRPSSSATTPVSCSTSLPDAPEQAHPGAVHAGATVIAEPWDCSSAAARSRVSWNASGPASASFGSGSTNPTPPRPSSARRSAR